MLLVINQCAGPSSPKDHGPIKISNVILSRFSKNINVFESHEWNSGSNNQYSWAYYHLCWMWENRVKKSGFLWYFRTLNIWKKKSIIILEAFEFKLNWFYSGMKSNSNICIQGFKQFHLTYFDFIGIVHKYTMCVLEDSLRVHQKNTESATKYLKIILRSK